MFSISSILWPTDGSQASVKALDAAVEIALSFQAGIYGLRVVPPVPPLVEGSGYGNTAIQGFDVPLYQQELIKTARNEIERAMSDKIPDEIGTQTEVRLGVPEDVIHEFSQEKKIDIIVMSTHGRAGLSRLMLGSVTEKTIRQSTIPMLVVPVNDETA